jgi:hypothetical protein
MAALVLAMAAFSKVAESTTRGTSGTEAMRWPRAKRREGTEEAARAEAVAKRLSDCQFLVVRSVHAIISYLWPRLTF